MEANRQIAALLAASEPVTIGKWTFHADSLLLECSDNSVKLEPRVAYNSGDSKLNSISKLSGARSEKESRVVRAYTRQVDQSKCDK